LKETGDIYQPLIILAAILETSARDEVQPAFVTRNVFGNEDSSSLKVYKSGRRKISSLRNGEGKSVRQREVYESKFCS